MLRAFIALEIPAEIRSTIARSLAPLQKALPGAIVRWVAAQNLHLTLKFLGEVSPASLQQLAEVLREETCAHEAFTISLKGMGAFPSTSRARILWMGLEAPPTLKQLALGIESVAARLGFAAEQRPFNPHLTVGRVRQNVPPSDLQRLQSVLNDYPIDVIGSFLVDAVAIIRSDLQPRGPVYTLLYSLPFGSE
jgi:RNA 2',3'-cyclic 3'-phosphodiesterase